MLPSNPPNTSGSARLLVDAPGYAVGWQTPLYLPNPAAGQFWSHTVDGRYFERLIAVTFTLVTSAVVANRFISVQIADTNGKVVAAVPAAGAVVASSTATPSLMRNAPAFASATSGGIPGFLPDILMAPGWTVSATGFNLDVGDQFSAITLLVQQFPNDTAAVPPA